MVHFNILDRGIEFYIGAFNYDIIVILDDLLAWHFDKKGIFSVKSNYLVLVDDKERLAASKERVARA